MPELSLATFNTHWGVDRRGRPYDVVDACRRLAADVIVLQEAWRGDGTPGFAAEVGETLGYDVRQVTLARGDVGARPRVPRPTGTSRGDWGVAVLARGTAVKVVGEDHIDLGQLRLDPAHRYGLRVDLEVDRASFCLIGTHLSHLTHGSLIQLGRLRATLPGPEQPAALAGDMNMWGPLVSASLPGWRRSVKGRSWPARFPHSQIDHVLVTPTVAVLDGGVLPRLGSDHRPLRARLVFSSDGR